MKSAVLLCALLGAGALAWAVPVRSPGAVTAVEVTAHGARLRTAQAWVELSAYAPGVVRVRLDQQRLGRDFSYAVTAAPAGPVRVTETPDEVLLSTTELQVHVARHPFGLRFTTVDGRTINQDEPGLGTSWIGTGVTSYKTLQEGERFIGLGEKTGNLDRRGSAYTNWNTDAFRYGPGTDPLYATIPFYMGVHHGLVYGIFLDNSYRSDFNFGASNNRFASFAAHGGEMNYYFIHAADVPGILKEYSALTGRMPLPPLWSLGYQQNRYSYYPEAEVMRVAHTLRDKAIPADGITLDIDYMDGYKLFTWDATRFPDPAGMTARLRALGLHTTVIVDPGVKVKPGYAVYDSGRAADIFAKYPDGSAYTGEVWPGWCNFPDFTSAAARAWWSAQVGAFARAGVDGLWNDMNEFSTWGQNAPANVLFAFDGEPATHEQARNVYALNMARASYDGLRAATGRRPFILTRSGFAGLQRYSAIWTGDNTATDEHMLLGVRLLNSLGLSGVPFTGMDIGGFLGTPSPALYARWMQIGAFTPYFRNHAAKDSRSSEPWTYGQDVLDIARRYIGLRYRLLPYLYSAFYQAADSGMPVMRSLAIASPHEARVFDPAYQNEYQFGDAFLVAPFESTRDLGKVFLPRGRWYDLYTDAAEEGDRERVVELRADTLPVWVKAGSVVAAQPLVQSTADDPGTTLTLHIYRGDDTNSTVYFEDDGSSFDYQRGAYYKRTIAYDGKARRIVLGAPEGRRPSRFRRLELVWHGFGGLRQVRVNGKPLDLVAGVVDYLGQAPVGKAVINNEAGALTLAY